MDVDHTSVLAAASPLKGEDITISVASDEGWASDKTPELTKKSLACRCHDFFPFEV
jgi:hypothetical protein